MVNAAGASGAPEICASLGIELPIESRKRFTFVFECREPIGPTPLTITEAGVAFRSEGKGFISNVSPPPECDPVTKDAEIEYELFEELIWPALAMRVPAFEAIRQTGAWCCHYDYNTLDENLIIGRTPAYGNFYLAVGFSGHGLQQSPAGGTRPRRAHRIRGIPHHRSRPLRLRTGADRRGTQGAELLLRAADGARAHPPPAERCMNEGGAIGAGLRESADAIPFPSFAATGFARIRDRARNGRHSRSFGPAARWALQVQAAHLSSGEPKAYRVPLGQ